MEIGGGSIQPAWADEDGGIGGGGGAEAIGGGAVAADVAHE